MDVYDEEEAVAALPAPPAEELAIEGAEELAQEVVVPPPEPQPESLEMRLRREAQSEQHMMTHLPMNNFCDVCREGKLKQKPARRRRDPEM
eukprot:10498281-Heterocapsa_arctica.AAC.1